MTDPNIMQGLGQALLKAGAPMLKQVVENSIGGVGGKIAGAAVDALAEQLGVSAVPEKRAEAVLRRIEEKPEESAPVVRQVEEEYARTVEVSVGSLERYHDLLVLDAKSEGLVSKMWRPLFAITYTVLFAIQVVTMCWLMWTRQWGTLNEIGDIAGFLTFMNVAALGVLGVQIWKRTEEKQSGVA